jgi:hypothetical protein
MVVANANPGTERNPAESKTRHDIFKVTGAVQVHPGKYASGSSRHRQLDRLSATSGPFGEYDGQPFFDERRKRTAFFGGLSFGAAQEFFT